MDKIKAWIETHPYLAGGAALAVVVLVLLIRRASAASSGSTTDTGATGVDATDAAYQEAELEAATELQSAQIQANSATDAAQATTNQQALTQAAQLQADQLSAQVALQQAVSGQESADEQTQAQLQLGLSQTLAGGGVSGSQATNTIFGQTELTADQVTNQTAQQQAIDTATGSATSAAPVTTVVSVPSAGSSASDGTDPAGNSTALQEYNAGALDTVNLAGGGSAYVNPSLYVQAPVELSLPSSGESLGQYLSGIPSAQPLGPTASSGAVQNQEEEVLAAESLYSQANAGGGLVVNTPAAGLNLYSLNPGGTETEGEA
jgi:hypothetical protein